MLIENAKKGKRVLINSIEKTRIDYGINVHMERMVGKSYTIQEVGNGIVQVNGWNWNPVDLTLVGKENAKIEEVKPQLFDPVNLVI